MTGKDLIRIIESEHLEDYTVVLDHVVATPIVAVAYRIDDEKKEFAVI